jgi:hypothetical protein
MSRTKLRRLFFDATNRQMAVIGAVRPRTVDINGGVIRWPVSPGDYIVIYTTVPIHGGATKGATPPTASDPQLHAGVHDFTVPAECDTVAVVGDGTNAGTAWLSRTPREEWDDVP